jgi:hypothetical protein
MYFQSKQDIFDYVPQESTDGLCFGVSTGVAEDGKYEFEFHFDDQDDSSY